MENKSQIGMIVRKLLLAISFVIGFNYYFFSGSSSFGYNSILNFIILFLVYQLLRNSEKVEKKTGGVALIFGCILSTALFIGKVAYATNTFGELLHINIAILSLISIIGFAVVIKDVLSIVFRSIKEKQEDEIEPNQWKICKIQNIYFVLWISIFILWMPAFLAYYPGIFSYDSGRQLGQAMGESFSEITKFDPPIHTMILKACIYLEQKIHVKTIIIYSISQMIFLSAVMAKMIDFMIKKKVNNWVILVSYLFVTINPVIAIFSMILTKDVYFAAFTALVFIELIKINDNTEEYVKSWKNWLYLTIVMLFAILFRNNAIYVYIIFIPVITIIMRPYWKKIIVMFSLPVILYFIVNNGIYDKVLEIGEGSPKEMLSVPIQQISYVVYLHDNELSIQEKQCIEDFLPYNDISEEYNPRFADPIKNQFKTEYYDENAVEFYKLWFELLKKYPDDYLTAFLTLNLPYWYPDAETNDIYSNREYIETNIMYMEYIERESKLPKLLDFYDEVTNYSKFEEKPIISTVFSPSFPIWFVLLSMCFILMSGYKKEIVIFVPHILLWATYLLGPVSNFRYMLPIFVTYPLLLALMLDTNKFFTKKEKNL